MRLTDLNPRWFAEEGRHGQGVTFDCPHCVGATEGKARLAVAFSPTLDGGAPIILGGKPDKFERLMLALCENGEDWPTDKVPPGIVWQRSGDTFETLTLAPSVDAGASGHWHGHVHAGEIR